jgi:peptidoglycan/LPS O-acetylase OafA/YrhL
MIVVFHTLMSVDGFAVQVSAIAASVALSWFLMHAVETPMKPLRDWLRGQPLGTDHRRQPTSVWY